MLIIGLLLAVPGFIFAFRWFSEHKFEYLDGVKPSEQLDRNFYLGMSFMALALFLILAKSV